MADYAKVDNTTAANLAKVNNVAKANIAKVNNCTTPSSGAEKWVLAADNAGIGYASNSDLTSWTTYITELSENDDYITIAYGKDGSGNPLWVAGWGDGDQELMYSSDITNTSGFSDVNLSPNKTIQNVHWGNNVWLAVGQMSGTDNKTILRSTDGSSWSEIDVSSIDSSSVTTDNVKAVCSDGAGNWLFSQKDRLYKSTNDGSTWTLAIDFDDTGISEIKDIQYTNSTWVVLLHRSSGGAGSGPYVRTAASSDVTDWSAEQDVNVGASIARFACGDGKCIFVYSNDHQLATVSGKTCTLATYTANQLTSSILNVATDGSGTFVAVGTLGDIEVTTDNGSNWTQTVDGLDQPGTTNVKLRAIAPNVYLPV